VEYLVNRIYQTLSRVPPNQVAGVEMVVTRFKEEVPFRIRKVNNAYEITGERIEKLVAMTDFNNEEALPRFQHIIERMGINQALKEKGVQNGDLVRIRDLEFEFQE